MLSSAHTHTDRQPTNQTNRQTHTHTTSTATTNVGKNVRFDGVGGLNLSGSHKIAKK